jgi:hypothetical protein
MACGCVIPRGRPPPTRPQMNTTPTTRRRSRRPGRRPSRRSRRSPTTTKCTSTTTMRKLKEGPAPAQLLEALLLSARQAWVVAPPPERPVLLARAQAPAPRVRRAPPLPSRQQHALRRRPRLARLARRRAPHLQTVLRCPVLPQPALRRWGQLLSLAERHKRKTTSTSTTATPRRPLPLLRRRKKTTNTSITTSRRIRPSTTTTRSPTRTRAAQPGPRGAVGRSSARSVLPRSGARTFSGTRRPSSQHPLRRRR